METKLISDNKSDINLFPLSSRFVFAIKMKQVKTKLFIDVGYHATLVVMSMIRLQMLRESRYVYDKHSFKMKMTSIFLDYQIFLCAEQ